MRALAWIGAPVIVIVGLAFLFPDRVNDFLFDPDAFASCFRSEVVAEIEAEATSTGNTLMAVTAERVLGPQVDNLAYSVASAIRQNGMRMELEKAEEISFREAQDRLSEQQETGELRAKETAGQVADATIECIERQVRI